MGATSQIMAQGITVATQEVGIMEVISGAGTMEVILVGGITEVCWESQHHNMRCGIRVTCSRIG